MPPGGWYGQRNVPYSFTRPQAPAAFDLMKSEPRAGRTLREAGESFVSDRAAEQRLRKAMISIGAGKTTPASSPCWKMAPVPAIAIAAAPVGGQTGEGRPMSAYRYQ